MVCRTTTTTTTTTSTLWQLHGSTENQLVAERRRHYGKLIITSKSTTRTENDRNRSIEHWRKTDELRTYCDSNEMNISEHSIITLIRTVKLQILKSHWELLTFAGRHMLQSFASRPITFSPETILKHSHFGHLLLLLLPLFYRTICISWHSQVRTGGFCFQQFYCPHARADGN